MDKSTDDIKWYISMVVTLLWPLVIEWLKAKWLLNRRKQNKIDD